MVKHKSGGTSRAYHEACHDVVLAAQEVVELFDQIDEAGVGLDEMADPIAIKMVALRAAVEAVEKG